MQLLYLQSAECPGLKQYIENKRYLSHEISMSRLVLWPTIIILRGIFHEIREAGTYVILGDETSYISLKEQLCMCIRWVDDKFDVNEAPLEIVHVLKRDFNTLTTVIKDCLYSTICLTTCPMQGTSL